MWAGIGSSLVGGALGGLTDIGTSLYGSHSSKKEARAADERSYQNSKKLFNYENLAGPKLSRMGLEAAGYNPILALTKGAVSTPVIGGHVGNTDIKSSGASSAFARMMYDATKNKADAEIENIKADTALKNKQTEFTDTQDERSTIGKYTDIANVLSHVLGSASSAYGAKKSADIASTIAGNVSRNTKPKPITNVEKTISQNIGTKGGSSKSLKIITDNLGLLGLAGIGALLGGGAGYTAGKNLERDITRGDHWDPKAKTNRKEKSRKNWYLYHDIGF